MLHATIVEYGAELGLALLAAASAALLALLVWWNATAVRRSEQRRRDLRERLFAILESATDVIITIDEDQRIRLFNRAAQQVFGYAAREVLGRRLDMLLPERYRQAQLEHIWQLTQPRTTRRAMGRLGTTFALRSNGEEFPIEASISEVQSAGGPVLTIILRDITERMRTEEALKQHVRSEAKLRDDVERHAATLERRVSERTRELQQANAQLIAVNRDLEEFTASAAHDLRAPLNAMTGYCSSLRGVLHERPVAEMHRRMDRIDTALRRMNDVIDGMLSLAQLTKFEAVRQEIDLDVLAAEIVQELQQEYPGHPVRYTSHCGSPLYGDPRLMRSLLVNLLGNAWKYTTKTAAPTVQLARLEGESVPTYCVRDNGAGFDMQFAQHLFEPFRRMHTCAEFPGVGIGLATAARIVQRYGGRIWAESRVGAGTTFYFTLPHAAERPARDDVAQTG